MSLAYIEGYIEAIDAVGQDHTKIPWREKNRPFSGTARLATPLVSTGQPDDLIDTFHLPTNYLNDGQGAFAIRTEILVRGVHNLSVDRPVCMALHVSLSYFAYEITNFASCQSIISPRLFFLPLTACSTDRYA
jgi:hypothetical protein